MIYFQTSSFPEAQDFITLYQLKKTDSIRPFQTFSGESAHLIISGSTAANTAASTAFLCGLYPPCACDLFVSYELCANGDSNQIVLANKLYDDTSNRYFYPDMLYHHPFQEVPFDKTQASPDHHATRNAAFTFQAASHFLSPDRIIIIRAFHAPQADCTAKTKILREAAPLIHQWLENIQATVSENAALPVSFTEQERQAIDSLSEQLLLTASMRGTLQKHLEYFKRTNPTQNITGLLTRCEISPPKTQGRHNKTEGKRLYAKLLQWLLE